MAGGFTYRGFVKRSWVFCDREWRGDLLTGNSKTFLFFVVTTTAVFIFFGLAQRKRKQKKCAQAGLQLVPLRCRRTQTAGGQGKTKPKEVRATVLVEWD